MRSPAGSPQHSPGRCEPRIELDPRTGVVNRDGRTIDLTPKERAVLEALLKASPAGLSQEKLLEQAWDEIADPFTTTVKVTIRRLRRKLGDPEIIKTTPGIGYRIATSESETSSQTDPRQHDGPHTIG